MEPKTCEYVFTGTLQSGDEIHFYSDGSYAQRLEDGFHSYGYWCVKEGRLNVTDRPDVMAPMPAVSELQDAYDEWRARMERVVSSLIVT